MVVCPEIYIVSIVEWDVFFGDISFSTSMIAPETWLEDHPFLLGWRNLVGANCLFS